MKYLAHCTFDEDNHSKHGYFTVLLSAENTEEAVQALRRKLMAIRSESDAFDNVDEIYLDDIIEIDQFPDAPVIMRYESMDLADQSTLSSNPIDQEGFQVYHWWPKGKERDYAGERYDIEPFVRWH
ncbi:MAG: hypothetical protein R2940_13975 [Syntrophotaleaceae bacterium]